MKNETTKLLKDIKKLLILTLIKRGVQSKEIASVLDVDPAIITRMVPTRKTKKQK